MSAACSTFLIGLIYTSSSRASLSMHLGMSSIHKLCTIHQNYKRDAPASLLPLPSSCHLQTCHAHVMNASHTLANGAQPVYKVRIIQVVMGKFPAEELEAWLPIFFLPLVTRIVNEPSPNCRAAVGATLALLLQVCFSSSALACAAGHNVISCDNGCDICMATRNSSWPTSKYILYFPANTLCSWPCGTTKCDCHV